MLNNEEMEELLEQADYDNSYEDSIMLDLVKLGHYPPDIFNGNLWTNNFLNRIHDPLTELLTEVFFEKYKLKPNYYTKDFDTSNDELGREAIDWLEKQWKSIEGHDDEMRKYTNNFMFESPLELFLYSVSHGMYPPPELLVMILKCFNLYLFAEGDLSLEEVFFGKPIKRSGNYAKRKAKSCNYKQFHYDVINTKAFSSIRKEKFSLEEFALDYLEKSIFHEIEDCPITVNEENIETYITGYYRWKRKHVSTPSNN